jgi:hypothetical protein
MSGLGALGLVAIVLGVLAIGAATIPHIPRIPRMPRPSTPMGWFWAVLITCNFLFLVIPTAFSDHSSASRGVALIIVFEAVYFVPIIVAQMREVTRLGPCFVVNFFLG